jgi:hypothetical protein
LLADGSRFVIFLQGANEVFIQRDSTQKLCVRFDSVMAAIGD